MPNFVPGIGPSGAKIMFVGEAPGKHEDEMRRPFVGDSGEVLGILCDEVGIDLSRCYVTNVRKYRPPNNDYTKFSIDEPSIESQHALLGAEINSVSPNIIIALGDKALQALTGHTGINKYRGSILKCVYNPQPKVLATFHPANLVRIANANEEHTTAGGVFKYAHKQTIRLDLKRALDESHFPDFRLPERNIEICRSSIDLQRFIDRSDRSRPLSVDIEALRCIPICIGISFSPHEAISIPLFNKLSAINYEGISPTELAYIWKDLDEVLHDARIIGQNFKYDEDKLYRLGFRVKLWGDTMLLAHTINPEMPQKSLAFLASIYTKEPFWKDDGKDFFSGKKSQRESFNKLLTYNGRDAAVTGELHEAMLAEARELDLEEYYFSCMMPRHRFYLDMERVGFRVDEKVREQLLEKYLMLYETIHAANTEVLGYELNVNSNPQVTKCLYQDLKFPYRFKRGTANTAKPLLVADEETITALLGNHAKTPKQKSVAQNILDERKIRKTISTYVTAKSDYDGRMRTSYNITGATTDRTSTSNISAPVRPEKSMGLGFQTLTKHGDIGADICEMFVPDEGYVFLNADLSQAEARVVFVLAEEWATLASLDDPTFDMHWKTAKIFFKELPDVYACKQTLSKEDPRRFIGKTIRHAGHLGAGKHQVMESVNTDAKKYGIDLAISEWKAGQYLDAFHAANPNIRSVFHSGIDELIANTRTLVGPRLVNPAGEVMRVGRRRQFFERYNSELLKSALADIPQHTISNQTKFAGIRISNRIHGIRFVLEGHDALLALVPKAEVEAHARIFREELEQPIDFSDCSLPRDYRLVIPADFSIGEKNYKDLVKLKGV